MKHKVVFGRRAQADLARIYDYLEPLAGQKTAQAFVEKIHSYCLGFDVFPERGMRRDDIREGIRLVGFRRHATIAFTVSGSDVVITRVFVRGEDVEGELLLF